MEHRKSHSQRWVLQRDPPARYRYEGSTGTPVPVIAILTYGQVVRLTCDLVEPVHTTGLFYTSTRRTT